MADIGEQIVIDEFVVDDFADFDFVEDTGETGGGKAGH